MMKYSFFGFFLNKNACQFVLFLSGSILFSGTVRAKEIYILPSISLQTEYDDNKRLRSGVGKFSAFGVIVRANAKLGVRTDRYDIALDNQVSINRYEIDADEVGIDLDSEDFKIDLTSSFLLTDRVQVGLTGNYTRDTSLSSELENEGTGLVQDNITRQKWSIAPNWSYFLSETQILQASYSHLEIDYDAKDASTLVDYSIDFASISFKQQWAPSFSNSLSVSAMYYEVPSIVNNVDYNRSRGSFDSRLIGFSDARQEITEYSVNLGAEYQISPTWSATANVGVRFTNTELATKTKLNGGVLVSDVSSENDTLGLVFDVSVSKQFEIGSAELSYSRSTSAQGDGRLQVRDSFMADLSYQFSQKIYLSLNGSITNSSSANNGNNRNDRDYYRISPLVRWAFDKQASLAAGYQYRRQKYESSNEVAISNSVFLMFNYRWDKISTQRY